MGAPYALSSDLVSAWPAKSLEVAQYIDGQVPLLAMTQNPQTGTTYSFVAADFTKLVTLSNASPVAVTLPLEATVPWPTGTQLRLLNQGAGTVTVAGAVGVTINGTPLTLTQYKGANLIKTGTNVWTFIPFASGVGAANFSDAATGTYTGFKYKTFTSGSGTLTVTTAGLADIVVVGGGGAGGSGAFYGAGGGGAGGVIALSNVYLPAGTLTVTVGAGSAKSALQGSPTFLGDFVAIGGGLGGAFDAASPIVDYMPGINGGSGGGGNTQTNGSRNGGAGLLGQGFAGGLGVSSTTNGQGSGGGGGASAVGAAGVTSTGGAGGAGTTTSIAGTTPSGAYVAGSYAIGGGGGGCGTTNGAGGSGGGGAAAATTGNPGAVNTGGGGGGGFVASTGGTGGAGGSGIVIVRVAV
jgi:hypothetical protein